MLISGEGKFQGEESLFIRLTDNDFPKVEHLSDAVKAVLPEGYSGDSDDLNLASFFRDQGETGEAGILKNVFDNKYIISQKTVEDNDNQWRGVVQLARYQNYNPDNNVVFSEEVWHAVPASDKFDELFFEQFFLLSKYVESTVLTPETLSNVTIFTKLHTLDEAANYSIAVFSAAGDKSNYPVDETFFDFAFPHLPTLDVLRTLFHLPVAVQSLTHPSFLARYYSLFPDTNYELFRRKGYSYEDVISAYVLTGSNNMDDIIALLESLPREYILRMGNACFNL